MFIENIHILLVLKFKKFHIKKNYYISRLKKGEFVILQKKFVIFVIFIIFK